MGKSYLKAAKWHYSPRSQAGRQGCGHRELTEQSTQRNYSGALTPKNPEITNQVNYGGVGA